VVAFQSHLSPKCFVAFFSLIHVLLFFVTGFVHKILSPRLRTLRHLQQVSMIFRSLLSRLLSIYRHVFSSGRLLCARSLCFTCVNSLEICSLAAKPNWPVIYDHHHKQLLCPSPLSDCLALLHRSPSLSTPLLQLIAIFVVFVASDRSFTPPPPLRLGRRFRSLSVLSFSLAQTTLDVSSNFASLTISVCFRATPLEQCFDFSELTHKHSKGDNARTR
jgi:hypothetical protein